MEPLLITSIVLIVIGTLGWVLPQRWNILRIKRRYASFVPERLLMLFPKLMGSILILAGSVLLIASATILKSDERGIPVIVHNRFSQDFNLLILEFPVDNVVARATDLSRNASTTLFVKPTFEGKITFVYRGTNQDKTHGGTIPVTIGPGSVGNIEVTVNSNGAIEVSDGIIGR